VFSFSPIDGKILAYVGGKDYYNSQFDRITQAIRPPGSSFKPFVYATAIEKGMEPNDFIDDLPFRIGDWSPNNYHNKYRGPIPAYTALMLSSNVCAARLIEYTGVRSVIQMARLLGITTPIAYDYTIALGSNGVKLYDLTKAYGAFANGGYRVHPYAVERVETSRGTVVYESPKTKVYKVMDENTASILTAMLKTVPIRGTGRAAYIQKPMAGKTGTTDDYRDAWFMGYTPHIVTGVWVGNDDNKTVGSITGGTVPALIWKDVMKVATEDYGNVDFNYPEVELRNFSLKDKGLIINKELLVECEEGEECNLDENEILVDEDGNELLIEQTEFVPASIKYGFRYSGDMETEELIYEEPEFSFDKIKRKPKNAVQEKLNDFFGSDEAGQGSQGVQNINNFSGFMFKKKQNKPKILPAPVPMNSTSKPNFAPIPTARHLDIMGH
jgi:membrane peptidoglycan carboxypeptidase